MLRCIRFALLAAGSLLMLPAAVAQAADVLPFHGWTLTHNDTAYNLSVLDRMPEFGVTHVQLSHNIVTRIDQFAEDDVVTRVKTLADKIHVQGGSVIVWAQELSYDTTTFCFDLDGDDMQARMQAYRDALTRVPEIDGVMISFGSAPTELATVIPSCQLLQYSVIAERYKAMIEAVSRVVMDEFHKQVYVRTFYHKGYEIPYLRTALEETQRPIVAMTKAEPNDFEPYYPLDPLIGDIGAHDQFLELDCAGEYWGRGAIPFVAVEYFAQRFRETRTQSTGDSHFIGSTCRVDRYDRPALGSLNEANISAQAQLVQDPDAEWQAMLSHFIEARFGLQQDRAAHRQLFDILRRTYWIGRKMYYSKGDWAFTKGSELPASNTEALSLLVDKTISQWDPAYTPITLLLITPDRQTILELLQEKHEAMELAQANLDALPAVQSAVSVDDYTHLETLLLKQRVATEIWFNMAGALYGSRNLSLETTSWALWHLDELDRLADALDAQAYPLIVDPYPFSSEDIREFVDNTRSALILGGDASEPTWLAIDGVDIVSTDAHSATIVWKAKAGVRYTIELTQQLPSYPTTLELDTVAGEDTSAQALIEHLEPQTPYWFRIRAQGGGDTMVSGDYTLWTRKEAIDTEEPQEPEEPGNPPGGGEEPDASSGGAGALNPAWLLTLLVIALARQRAHRGRR